MHKVTALTILVSCPFDMVEDRDKLRAYVQQYNSDYAQRQHFQFSVVDFSDIASQFGGPAQDIINQQFGNYDVYIGIMGARFGTPTREYKSGTEEEFSLAYKKHQAGEGTYVSFLFKKVTKALSDSSKADRDQYNAVCDFRDSISGDGVYKSYTSDADLQKELGLILDNVIEFYNAKSDTERLAVVSVQNQKPLIKAEFYSSFINSIGSPLSNGIKQISLDDIYTPLDLQVLTTSTDGKDGHIDDEHISTDALPTEAVNASGKVIILGDDSAGKTTLLKKLFLHYYTEGYLPVYISGSDIKRLKDDQFDKLVVSRYMEQYDNIGKEYLQQIGQEKCVVLLDDLDHSALNDSHKLQLLSAAVSKFSHVFTTCDEVYFLNLRLGVVDEGGILHQFKQYKMRDMGHLLRDKLIQKWIQAGREDVISDDELNKLTEENRATINSVIGTNYVPKKPLIVLVLLQAITTGSGNELTNTGFVRYYKYLIDTMLLHGIAKNKTDLYYAFIPEIAFGLFGEANKRLSDSRFNQIIDAFATRKSLPRGELIDVKNNLLQLGLLDHQNGTYTFKHPYIYYYFLAQYLHESISDADTLKIVEDLSLNLHLRENANIIVFLSHFNRSTVIVDSVRIVADSLFHSAATFDFESVNANTVNALIKEMPLVLASTDIKQDRENALKNRDSSEKVEIANDNDTARSSVDALDFTSQLNVAFRTVEIAGQLLKNHYATFDGTVKRDLYVSAINAAFRSLNVVIGVFVDNSDALSEWIAQTDPKFKDDAELKRIVFMILNSVIFNFIKTTSRFTGTENLRMTYAEVLKDHEQSLAFQILDFSIKLDSFSDFPMDDLNSLTHKCSKNFAALTILRNMVKHRLYMRPVANFREHQQICNAVGISTARQLLIEQKSVA